MTAPQRRKLLAGFASMTLAASLLAVQVAPAWADEAPVEIAGETEPAPEPVDVAEPPRASDEEPEQVTTVDPTIKSPSDLVPPPEPVAVTAAQVPLAAAAVIPEIELVGIAAAPVSDGALIAWVGSPEPPTKTTLQLALNAASAGETVHLVPGAYQFSLLLTATKTVTIEAASATQLFGRITFGGGALTTTNVVLSPAAASTSVLTVTTPSGASLSGIQIANPDGFAGATQIGINLGSATGVTVTSPTISGMTTGISAAAANTGAGLTITGATIAFRAKGIVLGGTSAPTVTGSTLTGPTGSGTMGIDYGTSSSAILTNNAISGVLAGISSAATASTAAGPQISGGTIEATGNAINLTATTGARVTGIALTCLVPTNSASAIGVNINNASDVIVLNTTTTGFATGVAVTNASAPTGIQVTGGDFAAVTNAITLGSAVSPVVTGATVRGQERAGTLGTTGVNVFNATGALIQDLTSVGPRKGISVAVGNTSTGLRIIRGTFAVPDVGSSVGIELGGTVGALVRSPTITGANRITSRIGITTARAEGATITGAVISTVAQGISGTWVREGGTVLTGHTITGARITNVGIGIYTANTDGTTVDDAIIDAYGEGAAGHEDANFTLTNSQVTGHPGAGSASSGTNCVRFYYTRGITVTNVVTTGGATGLYLDMSYDAVATNLDISGATWYGTYAESITGYELRNSRLHDNAGIANLTINPSSLDSLDLRQVSSGIVFADNVFTNNLAGVYLPLGVQDFAFQRNTVSGTHTFVILAVPAHGVVVSDNRIDYTHDAALLAEAVVRSELPGLGDPLPPPLLEETPPPDLEPAALGDPVPFFAEPLAAPLAIASPIPPPTPAAGIWVAPTWFNLDTQSASSDEIAVLDNVFTGDGPFIGVGSVNPVGPATTDAPPNPSAMRTLRDTIEVSRNVFPKDSTAIVTVADAETGDDADTSNAMINGNAAVDARGNNDWGSPCYARAPTDGYDGGGAFIHEVLDTQVLYPQGCATVDPAAGVAATGVSLRALPWAFLATGVGAVLLVITLLRRRGSAPRVR
jgi:hypothetical protein